MKKTCGFLRNRLSDGGGRSFQKTGRARVKVVRETGRVSVSSGRKRETGTWWWKPKESESIQRNKLAKMK